MILGVMTRVALGHTGRPLQVSTSIVVAYVLVTAGALVRVAAPSLATVDYVHSLTVAMIAWGGAFVVFVAAYWRILLSPRVPG
jgi:uncharacterized protein involved in response to NO